VYVRGPKAVGKDIDFFRKPTSFTVQPNSRVVCSEITGGASGICRHHEILAYGKNILRVVTNLLREIHDGIRHNLEA
jgi:hypothetical protein